jgi:hypothetical protein
MSIAFTAFHPKEQLSERCALERQKRRRYLHSRRRFMLSGHNWTTLELLWLLSGRRWPMQETSDSMMLPSRSLDANPLNGFGSPSGGYLQWSWWWPVPLSASQGTEVG